MLSLSSYQAPFLSSCAGRSAKAQGQRELGRETCSSMDVGFLRIERELIAEGIDWLKPALRLCERLGGVDFMFHQLWMGDGMIGF